MRCTHALTHGRKALNFIYENNNYKRVYVSITCSYSAMIKITLSTDRALKANKVGKNSLLLLSNLAQQFGIIKSSLVPQK